MIDCLVARFCYVLAYIANEWNIINVLQLKTFPLGISLSENLRRGQCCELVGKLKLDGSNV